MLGIDHAKASVDMIEKNPDRIDSFENYLTHPGVHESAVLVLLYLRIKLNMYDSVQDVQSIVLE